MDIVRFDQILEKMNVINAIANKFKILVFVLLFSCLSYASVYTASNILDGRVFEIGNHVILVESNSFHFYKKEITFNFK